MLTDTTLSPSTEPPILPPLSSEQAANTPKVSEILLTGLGGAGDRPILLARLDDHELLAYEAFAYYNNSRKDGEGLKMRFKKLKHGLILRERKGK